MGIIDILAGLAIGYALGSVPFGLLLARAFGAGDLRDIGSGNIGATNVLRTGRRGLAAATLVLDAGKGALAVWIAWWLIVMPHAWLGSGAAIPALADGLVGVPQVPAPMLAAGLGAMLGHCFPVWLDFRGGKGVATMLGVAAGLVWPVGVAYAVIWCGTLAGTRISSVSGLAAAVSAPVAALALGQNSVAGVLALMAAVTVWLHRGNIARLRAGIEPRIGASKSPRDSANDDG